MGKDVILKIIKKLKTDNIMKCPLCGKELEPMAQNTAHPSQKPKWIILYHHTKNGCKLELNTLTEQSWVERSKSSLV